jgi:FlaA1/EpsC-like NDP-sugar epimerase
LAAVSGSSLFLTLMAYLTGMVSVPRSVVLLFPIVGTLALWVSRRSVALAFDWAGAKAPLVVRGAVSKKKVLIYGAGKPGMHLLDALRDTGIYLPVGFVDTDPALWGQYVSELKVHPPSKMPGLIGRQEITEVLLALPRRYRQERRAALKQLEALSVPVRTLPPIEDLIEGRVIVSDLRHVDADDLLKREQVAPNALLLARNIEDKSVLVTGAGGSVGSELVRQALAQRPRRLVLLDHSEEHLYDIGDRLEGLLKRGRAGVDRPEIVSVLGSVQDEGLVRRTIDTNSVETVYHAAAFKHVPILERNAVVGLGNNTFGTAVLADVAEKGGVETFVLISTDKAVRPTSIMGASKRLAEMILQARAAQREAHTVFTTVRFGNVLDSSGSVMRRFHRQIEAGGPVTVTHPDATRYLMSIPEAASLVIQAGALATGGEVFVLDMGNPVRIDDLARSMIRLMGFEVRDEEHFDGDIAIEYVGLREGEKLHEELLLGTGATSTGHPRIFRSSEPSLPQNELAEALNTLRRAMEAGRMEFIRPLLSRVVEGFPAK